MTASNGELVYEDEDSKAKVFDHGDGAPVVVLYANGRSLNVATGHGHDYDLGMANEFARTAGPCRNCGGRKSAPKAAHKAPARSAPMAISPEAAEGAVKVPGL